MALGDTTRQRIRYDSGLTLWVNWRAEPWQVEGRTLPQWGFLALGPATEASTTLRAGQFADWVECPAYFFADARTSFNMPYRKVTITVHRLAAGDARDLGPAEVTWDDDRLLLQFGEPGVGRYLIRW